MERQVVATESHFCDNCTERSNFLGPVSPEQASVTTSTQIATKDPDKVALYGAITFVDQDGGMSEAVSVWQTVDKVGSSRSERSRQRQNRQFAGVVKQVMPRVVERIGLCPQASINDEGKLSCPAFNENIFKSLIAATTTESASETQS